MSSEFRSPGVKGTISTKYQILHNVVVSQNNLHYQMIFLNLGPARLALCHPECWSANFLIIYEGLFVLSDIIRLSEPSVLLRQLRCVI